jgi:hypothetical protein
VAVGVEMGCKSGSTDSLASIIITNVITTTAGCCYLKRGHAHYSKYTVAGRHSWALSLARYAVVHPSADAIASNKT